jgi:hypothetical protein
MSTASAENDWAVDARGAAADMKTAAAPSTAAADESRLMRGKKAKSRQVRQPARSDYSRVPQTLTAILET